MDKNKIISLAAALIILCQNAPAYGTVISNRIRSTIIVNHSSYDPVLVELLYNDRDLGTMDSCYTQASVSNYEAVADLRDSTANSIRYLKLRASTVSRMEVLLPEYGPIDLGRVEKVKADYKDLSKIPASSPIDNDKDGISLVTMERLASMDGDGDDGKLTVPCTIYDLYDENSSGSMSICVLLPDVAAAWGNNSHIDGAVYNYNYSGQLFIKNTAPDFNTNLDIVARSNKPVENVRYVVSHVLAGEEFIMAQYDGGPIQPGSDVNISIPLTLDKAGEYWLKVYPVDWEL